MNVSRTTTLGLMFLSFAMGIIAMAVIVSFLLVPQPVAAHISSIQVPPDACTFTKPVGAYILCVVYEEEAGSFQDILEMNPRTQALYIFNPEGEICFWDLFIGNTRESDVNVTQDAGVYLLGYQRWLIQFQRGLMSDVEHLLILSDSGAGTCLADQ